MFFVARRTIPPVGRRKVLRDVDQSEFIQRRLHHLRQGIEHQMSLRFDAELAALFFKGQVYRAPCVGRGRCHLSARVAAIDVPRPAIPPKLWTVIEAMTAWFNVRQAT